MGGAVAAVPLVIRAVVHTLATMGVGARIPIPAHPLVPVVVVVGRLPVVAPVTLIVLGDVLMQVVFL